MKDVFYHSIDKLMPKLSISENVRIYLVLIIVMAFWGISWPIARLMVGQATPFLIGFLRFFISGFFFAGFLIYERKSRPLTQSKPPYLSFLIMGAIGIFGYGIFFLYGMKYTTSSQGAVLAGFQPVMASSIAHIWHKERLTPRWKYLGFLASFIGVICIIGIQPLLEFNPAHLLGNFLVLGAIACWAVYTNYGKHFLTKQSPISTTAWSCIFGMILFGGSAVIENRWNTLFNTTVAFWIGLIILALGTTVFAYIMNFYAIKRIGVTRTGIFINLVPVFGTIFSFLILKETLTWTLFLGLVGVSIGILFINWPDQKSKQKLEPIIESNQSHEKI